MPKPRDTRLAMRATVFSHASCVRGRNSMTSTPASGVKIPALSSQLWSVRFIPLLHGDDEDEGAEGSRAEQESPVLLDLAGLHGTQRLAAAFGCGAAAVDDAVDHLLVELVGDPACPS